MSDASVYSPATTVEYETRRSDTLPHWRSDLEWEERILQSQVYDLEHPVLPLYQCHDDETDYRPPLPASLSAR
jgi:hypothetical protein